MRSKLLQGALLSAISVLAGLVILEIVVRLMFGSPWPEKLPVVRVQPDADIGWRMVPGDFHYTYEHPVQLNALGFRGPEMEPKILEPKSHHEIPIRLLCDFWQFYHRQSEQNRCLHSQRCERSLRKDVRL